jgi:hypothetical protein
MDKSDTGQYINNIMTEIETSHADILKQVEAGIRKRLHEEKTGDTIEAQLFKIHTGPETEGMYRLHRLGESAAGFGGGLISSGAGGRSSSKYFQERYPSEVKSGGENPEEEFNTMLNEMVRFGIQKGMDVKHAGEKPLAGEMVTYLSKGKKGAEEFWSKIQSEDKASPYKDLKEFAGDSEKAIRMRAGELPTSEILKEAQQITLARGGSTEGLDTSSRAKLVQVLVDKLGFKGFLEELSLMVQKEAIDGLVAQAQTWSPGKRGNPGGGLPPIKGDDLKAWATGAVNDQLKSGVISIRGDVSEAQNPLYGMRTYFSDPKSEYKKYTQKYGEMAVPKDQTSGISDEDQSKAYKYKYKTSVATASNLKNELKSASAGAGGGAYADMIKTSIDALYKQQEEIETYITSIKQDQGYNPETSKNADLVERVKTRKDIPKFASDILSMKKGMRGEVDRLSNLAGIPGLSDSELYNIHSETSGKFGGVKRAELKDSGKSKEQIESEVADYIDNMVEKSQALKQLDRVIDVFMSKQEEGKVLQTLFPRERQPEATYMDSRKDAFQANRSKVLEEQRRLNSGINEGESIASAPGGTGGEGFGRGFGSNFTGGGVVPVHIVSADPSVTINVRGLVGAGLTGGGSGSTVPQFEGINEELKQFAADADKLKASFMVVVTLILVIIEINQNLLLNNV